MRPGIVLLLLLCAMLAGCSKPAADLATPEPTTSCPDTTLRRTAYREAESFAKHDILGTAFTIRFEGTMEGKVGTRKLALDPAAKSLLLSDLENDIRVAGTEYSVSTAETQGYGRNFEPGARYGQIFALLEQSIKEPEPDFFDDLTVDDYTATCIEQGGVQAIRYAYEKDGRKDVNVAERAAPYRPLSGETVDPAMQDNYRASVAYARPTVAVDTTLPKLPLSVTIEPIRYVENDRGGLEMIAEVVEGSEWAPFSQIQTQLVGSDGTIYDARTLQAGLWDMEDGDIFQYQDRDLDGMLSTGDRFSMDLGPGLDVAFADLWAGAAVNLQATA